MLLYVQISPLYGAQSHLSLAVALISSRFASTINGWMLIIVSQEFMKHASNIARPPNEEITHNNFKLLTEDRDILTPELWVNLMEHEDLDNLQLLLVRDRKGLHESDDSSVC